MPSICAANIQLSDGEVKLWSPEAPDVLEIVEQFLKFPCSSGEAALTAITRCRAVGILLRLFPQNTLAILAIGWSDDSLG
jgi:hypothetical protein